jgi:hypothetical protein
MMHVVAARLQSRPTGKYHSYSRQSFVGVEFKRVHDYLQRLTLRILYTVEMCHNLSKYLLCMLRNV